MGNLDIATSERSSECRRFFYIYIFGKKKKKFTKKNINRVWRGKEKTFGNLIPLQRDDNLNE